MTSPQTVQLTSLWLDYRQVGLSANCLVTLDVMDQKQSIAPSPTLYIKVLNNKIQSGYS